MCAFVFPHVNDFRCLLDGAERGLHRAFRTADKGHNRPVGGCSRIDIEQSNAIHRFNRAGDLSNDIQIAPFRKIRDAFDQFLHILLVSRSRRHRDIDFVLGGKFNRARISGICVPENSHPRVAGKYALEPMCGVFAAVSDDDHAGVLRITNSHAAAVVDRNPGCASGCVDQRVE